jgi:hypothetical protein
MMSEIRDCCFVMRVAYCGLQNCLELFNLSVVLRAIWLTIPSANSELHQYISEQTTVEFAAVIIPKYARTRA